MIPEKLTLISLEERAFFLSQNSIKTKSNLSGLISIFVIVYERKKISYRGIGISNLYTVDSRYLEVEGTL